MTVFNMAESEGVWFDMEGGGRVKIKALSPKTYQRISKATMKKKPIALKVDGAGPPVLFDQEIIDEDLRSSLIHDAIIVDWEGFTDENKKAIPCTPENKTELMLMDSGVFRDFVNEKVTFLNESLAKKEKAKEKN
jgi:hypothetical protein